MLYEKVIKGKQVRYIEHDPNANVPHVMEFSNEELITLGVSLGTVMLMLLERQLPEKARNRRKIKAVHDAILDLSRGTGEPVSGEMIQYWANCWDETMQRISEGLIAKHEAEEKINVKSE